MITRRDFIAYLLSGTAAPAVLAVIGHPTASAAAESQPIVRLGFAGPRSIQILVEDAPVDLPVPRPVVPDALVQWSPDPDSRTGGLGRLGGETGNFTGDRHQTAAQLFRPYPAVGEQDLATAFLTRAGENAPPAAADDPDGWSVFVDGTALSVSRVLRKTTPIQNISTAPGDSIHRHRHLVTLRLDRQIDEGAKVRVEGPGIAPTEVVRGPDIVSEAVHVCLAGYPLSGPKKAYVGLWLGIDRDGRAATTDDALSEDVGWRLVDAENAETVLEGDLRMAKPVSEPHFDDLNFNGCDIFEADFSDHDQEGMFRLVVDGIGTSPAFAVEEAPYSEAFRLAARWYFHQRSGCAIEAPFGEGRTRPRNGHPDDGLTVWQTDVQLGRTSEGFERKPYSPKALAREPKEHPNPHAWGGWHDAGDWDRRIQHMDAVYQMANMVELFAAARTLQMNIPESGKTFADPAVMAKKSPEDVGDGRTVLPDLVHEALWGISLWRRTQGRTGGIIGGVEYSLDGIEGSVSWDPVQETYAYAEEEWATYRFAAAAAKLGQVIKVVCGDAVLGQSLIDEAVAAWTWAEEQRTSGSVGDSERAIDAIDKARVLASGPLYRAAGTQSARLTFEAHNPFDPASDEGDLGTKRDDLQHEGYDYIRAHEEGRETIKEIRWAITGWTQKRLGREVRIGADYGLHTTDRYPWGYGWMRFGPGSNWRASAVSLDSFVREEPEPRIRDIVLEGMWFGLGCNPANTSFIKGLGSRSFADMVAKDLEGFGPVPGQPAFGCAAGTLRPFEVRKAGNTIHPRDQTLWPRYAQIFESSAIIVCAEHGMKSNAMEWLFACAFANELTSHVRSGG